MALHDDVLAEMSLMGPQRGQCAALVRPDQAACHGEAAIGEISTVEHQDILPRSGGFFYPLPA